MSAQPSKLRSRPQKTGVRKSPLGSQFAARLRGRRLELSLSLQKLGDLSQTYPSILSQWELAITIPRSGQAIERVARALDLDPGELLSLALADKEVRAKLRGNALNQVGSASLQIVTALHRIGRAIEALRGREGQGGVGSGQ